MTALSTALVPFKSAPKAKKAASNKAVKVKQELERLCKAIDAEYSWEQDDLGFQLTVWPSEKKTKKTFKSFSYATLEHQLDFSAKTKTECLIQFIDEWNSPEIIKARYTRTKETPYRTITSRTNWVEMEKHQGYGYLPGDKALWSRCNLVALKHSAEALFGSATKIRNADKRKLEFWNWVFSIEQEYDNKLGDIASPATSARMITEVMRAMIVTNDNRINMNQSFFTPPAILVGHSRGTQIRNGSVSQDAKGNSARTEYTDHQTGTLTVNIRPTDKQDKLFKRDNMSYTNRESRYGWSVHFMHMDPVKSIGVNLFDKVISATTDYPELTPHSIKDRALKLLVSDYTEGTIEFQEANPEGRVSFINGDDMESIWYLHEKALKSKSKKVKKYLVIDINI